jgi:S-adenosylmethionine-diacylglycerol 3-amino-3-carboxypropyl transferase
MLGESSLTRKPTSGWPLALQNLLERLAFGSGLVFNQAWEDPLVDRRALALTPADVLFTLASAGDNTLASALDGPQKIYAVDLNPAQVYLLQLKIAAAQRLPYAEFWHLFSLGPAPRARAIYHGQLRAHLTPAARGFWDGRLNLLRSGLSRAGSFGCALWLLRSYLKVVCGPAALEAFFDQPSMPEQAEYYRRRIHGPWWNPLAKPLAAWLPVLLLFGAHPHQARRIRGQAFADFLAAGIGKALTTLPARDNYFWQQAFLGRYRTPPDYARPENFERLKQSVPVIETHLDRAQDVLRDLPRGRVTHFNLLDAPDWLSPAETLELWDLIRRAARPGAKVLFRTIDPAYRVPAPILAAWRDETDPAWVAQERTGIYAAVRLLALA